MRSRRPSATSQAESVGGRYLKRKEKGLPEKVFLSLLAAGALSFGAMVCGPNALRLRKLDGKVRGLRREVEALREERATLFSSVSALKRGDELAWEAEVRNRLGWVRPGEIALKREIPPETW